MFTPPSPWIGSNKHRADVLADGAARGHHVAQREKIVERHVLDVRQHRPERPPELRFGACRERTVALAVKAFGRRNDRLFRGIEGARQLERALHRFRAAVAEEAVVESRRREHRQRLRQHRAQRVEQVLAVQRLPAQLIAHRFDDLGMAMPDVKDAEAAQAVQVLAPVYVAVGVGPGIGPFDDRAGLARVGRFAVFEKSGIDVVAERVDRFASDPRRFVGSTSSVFAISARTRCVYS